MSVTKYSTFVASAIVSEIQSSDLYLTVKARLFDTKANLNNVKVTEAFISEIVENQDKYVGLPLYADVRGLVNGNTVGHMYDRSTGEFKSTSIGSFYAFEKEQTEDNTYLVGYARIMKRNKAVCAAVCNLFASGNLKFSFEITCGSYTQEPDGTCVIDVDESNYLEGVAIVTFPACEDAVALELVAEIESKGDENMADEIRAEENLNPVEPAIDDSSQCAEVAEENKETAETVEPEQAETVEAAESESETAEIVHRDVVEVTEHCSTYDTDTGEETSETVTHRVETTHVEDAAPTAQVAEATETAETEPVETESTVEVSEPEVGSLQDLYQQVAELRQMIAELQSTVKPSDPAPVAEEVIAEDAEAANPAGEDVNPFMASIDMPKKYSLLEKQEHASTYSLLEKY